MKATFFPFCSQVMGQPPFRRSVVLTKTRQDNTKHTHLLQILSKHSFGTCIHQAWAVSVSISSHRKRVNLWGIVSLVVDGMENVLAWVIVELSLYSPLIKAGQPRIYSWVVHLQLIFSVMVHCNNLKLKSIFGEIDQSTKLMLFFTVAELNFPLKQLPVIETKLY